MNFFKWINCSNLPNALGGEKPRADKFYTLTLFTSVCGSNEVRARNHVYKHVVGTCMGPQLGHRTTLVPKHLATLFHCILEDKYNFYAVNQAIGYLDHSWCSENFF